VIHHVEVCFSAAKKDEVTGVTLTVVVPRKLGTAACISANATYKAHVHA
jgi:hypothetical protein